MKKFNYGAKGWGIVIFCFFLFWVGSGCPVTSLNVIMSEYNAMYGWDIAVLNGFGTMANILSIIAAAVFGWWCKKRGPKSLILATLIVPFPRILFFQIYEILLQRKIVLFKSILDFIFRCRFM